MEVNAPNYSWEPVAHTADLAIGISASDQVGLFHAALDGLLGIIELPSDLRDTEKIESHAIELAGEVIEETLVDFLNECIYIMEVNVRIPIGLDSTEYEDGSLTADLKCRPIRDVERSEIGHVKAATYSALEVTHADGTYRATIIFDT